MTEKEYNKLQPGHVVANLKTRDLKVVEKVHDGYVCWKDGGSTPKSPHLMSPDYIPLLRDNEHHYKVEGNIIYPNKQMLTWGPFYYHDKDQAVARMPDILKDIEEWCNLQDPTLNIKAQDVFNTTNGEQVIFNIKAWRDDEHLDECRGIICVDYIVFED